MKNYRHARHLLSKFCMAHILRDESGLRKLKEVLNVALMGLDLGTTGVKSTITDNQGNILSAAYREYETTVPREGEYELDPSVVWSATKEVIQESKKFVKEDVLAVSVSSFGEAFVAVDDQGQPLMNTLLQTDRKSVV